MEADPPGQEAHWAAPVPGGCPAGLLLDGSAVRTADDHCARAGHRAQGVHSTADSAQGDSAVPMDDHCAPADHPVRGVRSRADSAQGDSAAPMDDHCALADRRAQSVRSARADSVAGDYSADWLRAGCWRRADLQAADCHRAGHLPVVRLGLVPGLAARVWLEEQPSHATLEHSPDAISRVPGEVRPFQGVAPAVSRERQMMAEAEVALSSRSPGGSRLPEAAPQPVLRCWHALPRRLRVPEQLRLWPSPASP